jgi:H+/Cl- antiporter ClcA
LSGSLKQDEANKMKSKNALVATALLFLALAAGTSVSIWGGISSPVKIAMFAFGFSCGIAVGTLIARRPSQ